MDEKYNNHEKSPGDIPTGSRMADVGTASMSAMGHKLKGTQAEQSGANFVVEMGAVEGMIKDWSAAPQRVARQMIEQYGAPNEGKGKGFIRH